jgi:hypothetical protein
MLDLAPTPYLLFETKHMKIKKKKKRYEIKESNGKGRGTTTEIKR